MSLPDGERPSEARWPATLAILAAIGLYVTLPDRYTVGPSWLMPAFESAMLVPLSLTAPRRHPNEGWWLRLGGMLLIGIVSAANFFSLGQLVTALLHGSKAPGSQLTFAAIQIWLTNVIVFALWFWELDRGGPGERQQAGRQPDFLFPQMTTRGLAPEDWMPGFVDYVYLAFTNAMAFSPTDTLPLTPWAKLLMLAESLASLLTVVFVAARAVNILS